MSAAFAPAGPVDVAEAVTGRVRFVILVPTYNHGKSLAAVVDAVMGLVADETIIVVDDGSNDSTSAVIETLQRRWGRRFSTIQHPANRGKGRALQTGFAQAVECGATHAVTLDADGQHHVPDILELMTAALESPDDLIIGERQMDGVAEVPAASRRGRDFSRFWLRVQTGQDVPDSQCGMRIYPLMHTARLPHVFPRFDFETETIARHAWAGLRVRSIPIRCIYFPLAQRISHYRPVIDTMRGVRMNVYLVVRRMLPLPFAKCAPHGVSGNRSDDKRTKRSSLKLFLIDLTSAGPSNTELSAAVAMGLFIGISPFYGLHAILAIYPARRLHLNIPAAVLGTQISFPLLAPFWWFLSLQAGTLLLRGHRFALSISQIMQLTFHEVMVHFMEACLGSVLVGLAVAAIGFFVMQAALRFIQPLVKSRT